nr:hypothetical protein [uncultured Mediterranean phage uvMED]
MELLIINVIVFIGIVFAVRKYQPELWAKIKQFLKF